jgi:hypothetical protein
MNVLLLHAEDSFPAKSSIKWDLIIDLARAPRSTYEQWMRQSGCDVVSIFDYSQGMHDLYRIREFLQAGMGTIIDGEGIDWWDVLSVMLVPELQRFLLMKRFAEELGNDAELYATRADGYSRTLSVILGKSVQTKAGARSLARRAQHYWEASANLDGRQLRQVIWDKFDSRHSLRRRLAAPISTVKGQVILLPSAYINVSRTAVSYAEILPHEDFLLVCARSCARLHRVPQNVTQISLDSFFCRSDQGEQDALARGFGQLEQATSRWPLEFHKIHEFGIMDRMRCLLPWGLAVRNAWKRVFGSMGVTACFSADESNPYTRIPLLLARQRGVPALSCHHGALDYNMSWKAASSDFYLAKSEMEKDYLERVCRADSARVVLAGPRRVQAANVASSTRKTWLIFFAEPFREGGWRDEEVYRELLPALLQLATDLSLRLVLKLHPFQSVRGIRRLLKRTSMGSGAEIKIIAGPLEEEIWDQVGIAITCQSSVALECSERGIPIFLFAWLRDTHTGYVDQFARFKVGHVLSCPEDITRIPTLLKHFKPAAGQCKSRSMEADPELMRNLLSGKSLPPVELPA